MAGTIILALISSGVLSTLITAFFQYLQAKKSRKDGLESKVTALVSDQEKLLKDMKRLEGDILRVEMKVMIANFPEREEDILKIGEHYFGELHRNWVMQASFQQYLDDRGIPTPTWFNGGEH